MDDADWLAARFEENRPHLRLVAYRMLGSMPEADDAVQDSWLRLSSANASELENLTGWLTTVVARECLRTLRARRRRREEPIGDTLVTAPAAADDPEAEALLDDAVGPALMVVLDTLAPAERLAFVLHDIFAVPFDEIAPIVGRSPAATRQLASRARRRVRGAEPATDTDLGRQRQVADAFLAALRRGDLGALIAVLDPDIVLREARAAPGAEPVRRGAHAVASYALRYSRQARFVRPALVDGIPGLAIVLLGRVIGALGFTYRGEAIIDIEMIDIPHRLRHDVTVSRDLRTYVAAGQVQNNPICTPQPICTSNNDARADRRDCALFPVSAWITYQGDRIPLSSILSTAPFTSRATRIASFTSSSEGLGGLCAGVLEAIACATEPAERAKRPDAGSELGDDSVLYRDVPAAAGHSEPLGFKQACPALAQRVVRQLVGTRQVPGRLSLRCCGQVPPGIRQHPPREPAVRGNLAEFPCADEFLDALASRFPAHPVPSSLNRGTSGRRVTSAWKPSVPSRHQASDRIVTLTSRARRLAAR